MNQIALPWIPAESKSALFSAIVDEMAATEMVTSDANEWGFFRLPSGRILVVGYANLGLLPVATVTNNHLLVGIDEILACYDVDTLQRKFFYHMPSVFHEFVSLANPIIARDEVGFVAISADGGECWKFLTNGPISNFSFESGRLFGETVDNERFEFSIPSGKVNGERERF